MEALKISPRSFDLLLSLWEAIGRVTEITEQWGQVVLHPLQKKRTRSEPASFGPIALLCHVRKLMEGAVRSDVQERVQMNANQWGNRINHSVASALLRYWFESRGRAWPESGLPQRPKRKVDGDAKRKDRSIPYRYDKAFLGS